MPSAPPDGEPAPVSGRLPDSAAREVGAMPFGAYVHVPFCATRCGYCDFNTYTAGELQGATEQQYVGAVLAEIELARNVVPHAPPLSTVFFGGGTPTLLAASDQTLILRALREAFGLADRAEITTEANPESVSPAQLADLREAGVNRISFGMQSARPHVLATLDRTHTPGRVVEAVAQARAAGFDNISLDLIYGTPGESLDDWRASLDAAIALEPQHVSAYALIVESGTALARQIDRGQVAAVDDDDQAAKYELADEVLSRSGYDWYEVSNWARSPELVSRHNLAYWTGRHWWGFGPGAHGHVGGVRWWNVRHPRAYAERMAAGVSPAQAREVLDAPTRHLEQVLLEVRLREGLPSVALSSAAVAEASTMAGEGLIDVDAWGSGVVVLTLRGRLLADLVVRRLVTAEEEWDVHADL
ncbi:MAG TPA: radical SAM family heme chaperone HemW [Actinomycetes bacterium]|jgi:putative oxygen-independent coproporphyrinogen III oxidase|nr:radical SAM family heme chaperone HemW [Actinomycetes bacterium]